jgi:hypothetical protein
MQLRKMIVIRQAVVMWIMSLSCLAIVAGHCLKLPDEDVCASENDPVESPAPGYTCWVGGDITCPMGNSVSGEDWLTTVAASCAGPRICRDEEGTDATWGENFPFNTDCRAGGTPCDHSS